mmetsp:Transcript_4355/g.11391  ORF Transcript_4355/g.11391 Transcript_4355/m.11391 type:complete len:481 (-) Transcript_4355:178-1620(-)
MLYVIAAVTTAAAWMPSGTVHMPHSAFTRQRPAVLGLRMSSMSTEDAVAAERRLIMEEEGAPAKAKDMDPAEDATISPVATINLKLGTAKTTVKVLGLVAAERSEMNAVNVATALHRLAIINKKQRASRDALLRSPQFTTLVEMVEVHAGSDFSARSISDALWSFATLQYLPPTLLKPLLTGVAEQLKLQAFEPQHLSTCVWALARLECKPVRLLEQIEEQAVPALDAMNVQNCANLVWGFSKLNYKPAKLLTPLSARLLEEGMIGAAKPVEVSDIALGLALVGTPKAHEDLLLGIAERAAPDPVFGCLHTFTSRQIVNLIWAFARLQAIESLPEGRMDAWVAAVKAAHVATPLLAQDARNLERALVSVGIDAEWIKSSDMLNTWSNLAGGMGRSRGGRAYTEEELLSVFKSIDSDSSGDIDQTELLEAIKVIKPDADDATVEDMLNFGDADGDKEVSFEEFKKIMGFKAPDEPATATEA